MPKKVKIKPKNKRVKNKEVKSEAIKQGYYKSKKRKKKPAKIDGIEEEKLKSEVEQIEKWVTDLNYFSNSIQYKPNVNPKIRKYIREYKSFLDEKLEEYQNYNKIMNQYEERMENYKKGMEVWKKYEGAYKEGKIKLKDLPPAPARPYKPYRPYFPNKPQFI